MDFVKNGYVNRNVLMSMYISADKPAKRREIREGYIRFCRNIVLRIKEKVIKEIIQSILEPKPYPGKIEYIQISLLEGMVAQVWTTSLDRIKRCSLQFLLKTESKSLLNHKH